MNSLLRNALSNRLGSGGVAAEEKDEGEGDEEEGSDGDDGAESEGKGVVDEADFMGAGGEGDGAKEVVSAEDGGLMFVYKGAPAGGVDFGEDEVAVGVGSGVEGDDVGTVARDFGGVGWGGVLDAGGGWICVGGFDGDKDGGITVGLLHGGEDEGKVVCGGTRIVEDTRARKGAFVFPNGDAACALECLCEIRRHRGISTGEDVFDVKKLVSVGIAPAGLFPVGVEIVEDERVIAVDVLEAIEQACVGTPETFHIGARVYAGETGVVAQKIYKVGALIAERGVGVTDIHIGTERKEVKENEGEG